MKAKPASDPTSWAYQAAIHGTHSASPRAQWNQCRHGSRYFVSWHRMYLYFFERIVRAQVVENGGPRNWALPYWNYDGGGNHNTLPLPFRSPTLAGGSKNPLHSQRGRGVNAGAGLPRSITSPAFALGRPIFTGASEFGGGIARPRGQFWAQTGRLEQTPHNDVHNAIGGLMLDPDTAAQDPSSGSTMRTSTACGGSGRSSMAIRPMPGGGDRHSGSSTSAASRSRRPMRTSWTRCNSSATRIISRPAGPECRSGKRGGGVAQPVA